MNVANRAVQVLVRLEQRVDGFELLNRFFGGFGVVPEIGLPHLIGNLRSRSQLARNVKESPAARSSERRSHRRGGADRRSYHFPCRSPASYGPFLLQFT